MSAGPDIVDKINILLVRNPKMHNLVMMNILNYTSNYKMYQMRFKSSLKGFSTKEIYGVIRLKPRL